MSAATGSKRIVWHSVAPWVGSGYGQQTGLFAPRLLRAGHDVIVSAIWGLGGNVLTTEDGIAVYPVDENWGNLTLPQIAERHNADLVITLMDVWVLNPAMAKMLPNLACWVPVDHQPAPAKVTAFLRESGCRPIAMSKFGETMLRDEGLDPLYIPHGVDTNVFKPLDRAAVRRMFGIDDSTFIVGLVAHNAGGVPPSGGVPRKAFPESLIAFSKFHQDHPTSKLYLHVEMTGKQFPGNAKAGLDLTKMIDQFHIPIEAVMLSNQLDLEIGAIDQTALASLYNAFDVLLNPSYGEGFGIPIVEAQACGTPVIVTDWTSMTELVGAGWMTHGDEPWYDPYHEAFFMRPRVAELVECLEAAHEAKGDPALQAQAREFALAYDADTVAERYWLPALEELGRPREVQPLNRAMRRAEQRRSPAHETARR